MEAIKKLIFDIANTTPATFSLGNFSKWGKVAIYAEWTGVDTADVVLSFKQRANSSNTWNTVPLLQYTITATPGSQTLEHREFSSAFVGVDIDINTASTGTITIYVIQKD